MTKFTTYLGFVMSVIFFVLGLYFLRYEIHLFAGEPSYTHYLVGIILVVYGIFRFYRAFKQLKSLS